MEKEKPKLALTEAETVGLKNIILWAMAQQAPWRCPIGVEDLEDLAGNRLRGASFAISELVEIARRYKEGGGIGEGWVRENFRELLHDGEIVFPTGTTLMHAETLENAVETLAGGPIEPKPPKNRYEIGIYLSNDAVRTGFSKGCGGILPNIKDSRYDRYELVASPDKSEIFAFDIPELKGELMMSAREEMKPAVYLSAYRHVADRFGNVVFHIGISKLNKGALQNVLDEADDMYIGPDAWEWKPMLHVRSLEAVPFSAVVKVEIEVKNKGELKEFKEKLEPLLRAKGLQYSVLFAGFTARVSPAGGEEEKGRRERDYYHEFVPTGNELQKAYLYKEIYQDMKKIMAAPGIEVTQFKLLFPSGRRPGHSPLFVAESPVKEEVYVGALKWHEKRFAEIFERLRCEWLAEEFTSPSFREALILLGERELTPGEVLAVLVGKALKEGRTDSEGASAALTTLRKDFPEVFAELCAIAKDVSAELFALAKKEEFQSGQ